MEYKVVTEKDLNNDFIKKMEDTISELNNEKDSLKTSISIMLGNYVVNANLTKVNNFLINVTEIKINKVSSIMGEIKFKDFITREYFTKVARVAFKLDKRNEDIKVVFSDNVNNFFNKYNIK